MPYPLGHTAIGLTTYELNGQKAAPAQRVWVFIFVLVLSNLPDLDILAGLLAGGNGHLFHRGPTHSLLFAIVMGYLASALAKRVAAVPPLGFGVCASLIFSHVLADAVFTDAPVSIFWPFEVHFASGNSSFGDIFHSIIFKSLGDAGIVLGCLMVIGLLRWVRATGVAQRIVQFKWLGQK